MIDLCCIVFRSRRSPDHARSPDRWHHRCPSPERVTGFFHPVQPVAELVTDLQSALRLKPMRRANTGFCYMCPSALAFTTMGLTATNESEKRQPSAVCGLPTNQPNPTSQSEHLSPIKTNPQDVQRS